VTSGQCRGGEYREVLQVFDEDNFEKKSKRVICGGRTVLGIGRRERSVKKLGEGENIRERVACVYKASTGSRETGGGKSKGKRVGGNQPTLPGEVEKGRARAGEIVS